MTCMFPPKFPSKKKEKLFLWPKLSLKKVLNRVVGLRFTGCLEGCALAGFHTSVYPSCFSSCAAANLISFIFHFETGAKKEKKGSHDK